MPRVVAIGGLDAANYPRHMLHAGARLWTEKNCYVDIWIELLHAWQREPLAMLGFTLAIDFQGDQWTFFKPAHDELRELYGVDVQELNVWRPLLEQALEYLDRRIPISTEADAFWLPDTTGTDYRQQHTKTTIVLNELDTERRRLGYFHNAGYFELDGEDFDRLFRVGAASDPAFMPLFAETVRVLEEPARSTSELRTVSRGLLRKYATRLPADNPVARFHARFDNDLPMVQSRGLEYYHAWAFATTRQLGAASELLSLHLQWLEQPGPGEFAVAIAAFDEIATACKTLILKGARAVNSKRPLDSKPLFEPLAEAWERGTASLR